MPSGFVGIVKGFLIRINGRIAKIASLGLVGFIHRIYRLEKRGIGIVDVALKALLNLSKKLLRNMCGNFPDLRFVVPSTFQSGPSRNSLQLNLRYFPQGLLYKQGRGGRSSAWIGQLHHYVRRRLVALTSALSWLSGIILVDNRAA